MIFILKEKLMNKLNIINKSMFLIYANICQYNKEKKIGGFKHELPSKTIQ